MVNSFNSFLSEQEGLEPYRILILKRDVPDDPNKTGDALEKEAKKIAAQRLAEKKAKEAEEKRKKEEQRRKE